MVTRKDNFCHCCLKEWLAEDVCHLWHLSLGLTLPVVALPARKMHTERNSQLIFSSWRIPFTVCYLLGVFPVQLDKTNQVFQFKPKSALLSGIFWTSAFSVAVYSQLHFILDIDVIGGANTVGCQKNVTRGPDVIYNILSSLYFLFDFFILVSGLLFTKHMAPALSKISTLVEEFVHLNKELPEVGGTLRPCFVNILPVVAQLIWQLLFHLKRSCLRDEFPSLQGIIASLLYLLIDLRSYLGCLVFYDSLFLFTKNTLVSCIEITVKSKNVEKMFKNCRLVEQLLVQLQDGFSYYLFIHISLLVLFSTLNTYFAII